MSEREYELLSIILWYLDDIERACGPVSLEPATRGPALIASIAGDILETYRAGDITIYEATRQLKARRAQGWQ